MAVDSDAAHRDALAFLQEARPARRIVQRHPFDADAPAVPEMDETRAPAEAVDLRERAAVSVERSGIEDGDVLGVFGEGLSRDRPRRALLTFAFRLL